MDELDVDDVVEEVEKRHQVRRADDTRKNALLIGLAGLLIAGGVAWGTAAAVVQHKVDREEFVAHVGATDKRLLVDSVERGQLTNQMSRIEAKLDSTNTRLSRLICDKQPAYCK